MGACKTHWPGAVQLLSKMKSSAVEADAFCGTALLPLLAWRKALYLHQKEVWFWGKLNRIGLRSFALELLW